MHFLRNIAEGRRNREGGDFHYSYSNFLMGRIGQLIKHDGRWCTSPDQQEHGKRNDCSTFETRRIGGMRRCAFGRFKYAWIQTHFKSKITSTIIRNTPHHI